MKAIKHTLVFTALALPALPDDGPNNARRRPHLADHHPDRPEQAVDQQHHQYNNADTTHSYTSDDNIKQDIDVNFVFDPNVSKGHAGLAR